MPMFAYKYFGIVHFICHQKYAHVMMGMCSPKYEYSTRTHTRTVPFCCFFTSACRCSATVPVDLRRPAQTVPCSGYGSTYWTVHS